MMFRSSSHKTVLSNSQSKRLRSASVIESSETRDPVKGHAVVTRGTDFLRKIAIPRFRPVKAH